MARRLFKGAVYLFSLGIVILLITAGLFVSEYGSRWLVYRLIDHYDIPLTMEKVQGRLLDVISFHGLHYRDRDGNEISADTIKLVWSATDLTRFHANVKTINVDQLSIKPAPVDGTAAPIIPNVEFPALPITVNIDNLELNDTRIFLADDEQRIKHAQVSLNINTDELILRIDDLRSANQRVTGIAMLARNKRPEVKIDVQWSGTIENKPGQGHIQLSGPQKDLALQFELDSIASIKAHGHLDLVTIPYSGNLQGEMTGELPQGMDDHVKIVSPLLFNLTGNMEFIEGKFATQLQPVSGEKLALEVESYIALPGTSSQALSINLDWKTTPENENSLLALSGQGNIEYQNEIITIEHLLLAPYAIHLAGDIDFARQTAIDLKLDWQDIRHAVSTDSALQVPSGFLNITGTPASLDIQTRMELAIVANVADDPVTGTDKAFNHLSMDGKLDTTPGFPTGEFSGKLVGPVPTVLQQYVKGLEPLLFNISLGQQAAELAVTGSGLSMNGDPFDLAVKTKMTIPGDEREALTADVEWSISPTTDPSPLEHFAGNGKLRYPGDRLVVTHDLLSPFPAKLDGTVVFNGEAESVLNFDIDWQDLAFPLEGSSPIQSKRGQVHLEGPVSSLAVQVDSHFESTPFGPADLDLITNWSPPVLKFTRLNLRALDGNMQGTGQVTIADMTRGQFDLNAREVNLESINPDLVCRIDLTAKLDFTLEEEGLNGRLRVPSLTGDWRGHPLRGIAEISRTANRVHIKDMHLESGRNTIDMQLEMNKSLAGFIDLSIIDMSIFSSELAGSINGRFDIGGTLEAARIDGQLRGENIHAFDLRIASVESDSFIDLRPQQKSTLNIHVKTLQYQDWLLDEINVKGNGLTESHSLELTASGKELKMTAGLDGQLRNRNWHGLLNNLDINTPVGDEWKLERPSQLAWQGDTNRFNVSDTCLDQGDASLCLSATGDIEKDAQATIKLVRLPMNMVRPWLPETVSLNGTVSGDTFLNRLDGRWELETRLEGADTHVSLGFGEDKETLDVQQVSLAAEATQHKREWNLQLSSPAYFDISLQGSVQKTVENPITADLKMNLHKIDWLAKIDPALTGSKGNFEARVHASGTFNRPVIQGEFNLHNGQLSILPIGLTLDRISGELRSGNEPGQMMIHSVLGSGGKQLDLTGHVGLIAEQDYPYQLQLSGEKFPVVRMADISMDASPELDLHGSLKLHHVGGNVSIPMLNILVTSLPEDSVSVSPDTVIIQSKKAGSIQVQDSTGRNDYIRNRLDVDINVSLGPDIHIQGLGLDTKLNGDINVVKPVGVYLPQGDGIVNLSEGSYSAYGQNLVIEKGQLLFAGPLDNPGINVRAYRPSLKVRPGVKVVGNVRKPKLSLYSDSGLSEADILSYLVTGRPITGVSSNEEATVLAQAALALGTMESTVLASEIENQFGLEKFTVGAGETYQSTSISATKRLSPNLAFSPSFNPFDQLWTFILNYRLTDHWSIQTESGISQAGEITYSIEANKVSEILRNIWIFND